MEERGFGVFYFGFLFQCPSEVKKGFLYLAVFVIVGFLDLGDVFFPCSFFHFTPCEAKGCGTADLSYCHAEFF